MRTFPFSIDDGSLDEERCREKLKLEYKSSRSKIPLLPGMPEEFANMDDLYVDLELSENQKHPAGVTEKKLESPHDLCNLKDKHGNTLKRALVRGGPGSGKTMLVSKLAYDWATKGLQNTKCDMLFTLDLREVTKDMDLIDIIQDQLLPKVSKRQLLEYIENNANSIIYLLDGFDEIANTNVGTDLKLVLSNKWLQESLVIVTTRPLKVSDFGREFGMYTLVDILKLSFQRISDFVVKFFNICPYLQYIYVEVEKQADGLSIFKIHPSVEKNKEKIRYVLNKLLEKRFTYTFAIKQDAEGLWEWYSLINASETLTPNIIPLKILLRDTLQTIWKIYGPPVKYIQACSRVLSGTNGLCWANFLEGCSPSKTPSLIHALDFSGKLCQYHVEIQSKLDEIDLDLQYMENPSDYLYKPSEAISKAVKGIRLFVEQLREVCVDMAKLLPNIVATVSQLNTYKSFADDPEAFHQPHRIDETQSSTQKSNGHPSTPLANVRNLCRLLKSALNIVEKMQFTSRAQGLGSTLHSSLQIDNSDMYAAWQSFCDTYYYNYQQIDALQRGANDVVAVIENLVTLEPPEELHRKIKQLQLYLSTLSTDHDVEGMQSIIDQACSYLNSLRTSRDLTSDFKVEFNIAMSFLQSFTCKSKEDTEKTLKDVVSLLVLLKSHQEYQALSEIPITLTMICLLWEENEDKSIPDTMTTLFQRCVCYIAEHGEVKTLKEQDLDYESIDEKLVEIMRRIGETAWKGLLQNKLTFSGKDFNASSLCESCRLGLLTKERKRSKLRSVEMISFPHRSFQEFSAAHYLVHLIEVNQDEFTTAVKHVIEENCKELALILQFCCGLNPVVAEILLLHVVDLSTTEMNRTQPWQNYPYETFHINCAGGGHCFDTAHVALLLFKEVQNPAFTRFLSPYFQNEELIFSVSSDTKSRYALQNFLDCQFKSPQHNVLDHVQSAKVYLDYHCSPQNAMIIGSLLQCMPNLTSLQMFCACEIYQHFSDHESAILNGFCKLRKLESLILGGYGDMSEVVDSLSQCETVTTIKKITIRSNQIGGKAIAALASKQTALSKLYVSSFADRSYADRSKSRQKTGALDRFLENCTEFDMQCLDEDEVKTILESIKSDSSMTEISLRGCAVPHVSLCRFLVSLRVLDIRCAEDLSKPFDSEGFFSMIIFLGQKCQEYMLENKTLSDDQDSSMVVFPLAILQLDNGRVSYNAVCAFAKATHFIRGLEGLTLGWDSLSEDCFPVIARELTLLSHLRFLNLTGNHIGNSIESMCKSLKDKPLESLVIAHTFLSELGAVLLGRYFQFWPGLVELDLSENDIGKGMLKLNRGLQSLVKLEKLKLVNSNLTDKGIVGLPLQSLVQLKELDISGEQYFYGPQGLEGLFRKVHHAGSLKIMLLNFKDAWLRENIFLSRCWQACQFINKMRLIRKFALFQEDVDDTIILRQNEVQELREFGRNL